MTRLRSTSAAIGQSFALIALLPRQLGRSRAWNSSSLLRNRSLLALGLVALVAGCGAGKKVPPTTTSAVAPPKTSLRIYDPKRLIHVQLTLADFVRSASRAELASFGQPEISLTLTRVGQRAFCRLTRGLALRGAQLHVMQKEAIAFDGRVVSKPYIDFRKVAHGVCGARRITILTKNIRTARRVARAIRG